MLGPEPPLSSPLDFLLLDSLLLEPPLLELLLDLELLPPELEPVLLEPPPDVPPVEPPLLAPPVLEALEVWEKRSLVDVKLAEVSVPREFRTTSEPEASSARRSTYSTTPAPFSSCHNSRKAFAINPSELRVLRAMQQ
ncbi:hypothetical protein [Alteriqipengyuania sp.]|uniref:hypothetical protein n=1 Tax=Alteriqipengyuania sp. TaxID=2800692 RepID=UPI003517F6B2